MNNIGLIISGNLTGFSRFYASPNANDIYNEAKFDFDYRNFLTFLNNDDKAYAISFAPTVISVSLVTRILDSFRRPGVLVVSILLPRNKKVESAMNSQNNKALYQLLNAVHDTFREKNFVNGMVNQNAAVLMQDYYTDILSNFVLVPDGLQRPINSRIDVSSPNKRLGYVKSTEDNVPLYLSSICRKSYESYHHVFIAENAPQNIDEEPIEVVFYSVKITNNGQRFQNVKLTDKIYNLQPEEGEIDIDKNFTYQQVVNGEAGRNIVASFAGDTIEITYRFGQEKRNIQFSFVDGGVVVPFASISPRVTLSNGEKFNIGSENWTFEGKEIYDRKTIESGNCNYVIKRESANLDIRRLKDGATCLIQVEQCCQIDFSFPKPYNKPKRITLKRRNGLSKSFIVEDYLNEVLPGKREEYSYIIESNFYETETGQMPPVGSSVNIILITKKEKQGNIARTNPTGQYADAKSNRIGAATKGTNVGGSLKLEGEKTVTTNTPIKKKNNKNVLWGSVAVSSVLLVLLLVFFWPNISKIISRGEETPDLVASNDSVDRDVVVKFVGIDNEPIEDIRAYGFTFEAFTKYVNVYVSPEEFVEKKESVTSGQFQLTYNVNGSASEIRELRFTISAAGIPITADGAKTIIDASELEDTVGFDGVLEIKLNVKASEISLYNELGNIDKITENQKKTYKERVDAIQNKDFAKPLQAILDALVPVKNDDKQKADLQKQQKQQQQQKQLEDQKQDENDILPNSIVNLVKGAKPVTSNSVLSQLKENQKKCISDYNAWIKDVYSKKDNDQQNQIKGELAQQTTFGGLRYMMRKYKGK